MKLLRIWLWRLVLIIFAAGITRSANHVWGDIKNTASSIQWPSVTGRVVGWADPNNRPFKSKHRADSIVEYRYQVGEHEYLGHNISFSRRDQWYHEEVQQFVSGFSSNPNVTVSYDRNAPEISVLQPGGSNTANIWFFVEQCIFIVGFLLLLIFELRGVKLRSNPGTVL